MREKGRRRIVARGSDRRKAREGTDRMRKKGQRRNIRGGYDRREAR